MSLGRKVQIQTQKGPSIDCDSKMREPGFTGGMKRLEREMSRFDSLLNNGPDPDSRPSSASSPGSEPPSSVEKISSPTVLETPAGRVLRLTFDVTDYSPEEILVKTVGNRLQVYAKHEEKSNSRSVLREYNRETLLPKGIDLNQIKSSLSRNGVLTVDAPFPKSD